jgi:arsenate reductase
MAEGFASDCIDKHNIQSAGTHPLPIHPLAITVMNEIGIDISNHKSKLISEDLIMSFDHVITLCGDARDQCLYFKKTSKKFIHWDIKDPAKASGSKENRLKVFRDIREQIKEKIKLFQNEISS